MIKKLLPHPLLTLALTIFWLMLLNSVSLGGLVFGVLLGIVVPILTAPYWPDRPRLRNPAMIAEYMIVVLWDIAVANVVVARTIIFKKNADIKSGWVTIPLELRTPEAITVLAGTITMTPGTVTSDLSADGRCLLVHYLDAADPDEVRDSIKRRYEGRLKEIFE
jgi:multicomponent K+:H+ antiporter subunit E